MTDAALIPDLATPFPLQLFRPLSTRMAAAIIARVRDEVPALTDPDGGYCQLLDVAARAGVRGLFDGEPAVPSAPAGPTGSRKPDELFRRLGRGEAQQGRARAPMLMALQVAGRCAWDQLADFAVAQQYSAATLRDAGAALLEYLEHLREQLLTGYELGSRFTDRERDRATARERLLDLFSRSPEGRISPLRPLGMRQDQLERLAATAEWPLPDYAVALAVTFYGDPPTLPDRDDILSRVEDDRVVVLCPEEAAEELADRLARSGTDRRVAISWPVRPDESGSALIWTARALDLVGLGVIHPTSLVRCSDHVTQLWLHAEPSMRQQLCQELLEPLLAETPNSREILSDTLLAWLETRDSAPAIAARLDVHPQTVRYRWKRINELFGDALHDPEFILQVTMVLKTSVLLWRAGNQGDFERFRDRKMPNR